MVRTHLLVAVLVALAACHTAPPPPPPPPAPLGDSAAAALQWVQSHATAINASDSVAGAAERNAIFALTSGARIIGFSELNEGTHEFPYLMRRAVLALADSGVRGVAVQASMPDAMEIDRYVRGGQGASGDARRLLRTLGIWRYETREMTAFVEALRAWNTAHPDRTIGFYGFEIPTAAHAVRVITSLPESITGAPLKTWLAQRYACVAMNEGAHWGLEGRAADSTFWSSCGPATTQALDSIVALRRRAGSRDAADLAFAEEMARVVAHHVSVGLRHMKREDANAEHVMFLANLLGEHARLVLWGGDVEMGRLTLEKTTVQTGVPLGQRLGADYRAIAFTYGDGVVRTHVPNPNQRPGDEPGLSDVSVPPPAPNSYEDVLRRASPSAYWLDMRTLPADAGGAWLKGPRSMRFITDIYTPLAPQTAFETPIQFPTNFDAVVFVRRVTPVR